jgi:hypothetical protein
LVREVLHLRPENNGAEEDEGISNCEEDAQNRRRYTPKGI